MSRKRVSTTVYLDAEQAEALSALSKATRVPQSVIIRDGVDAGIALWRAKASRMVDSTHDELDAPILDPEVGR